MMNKKKLATLTVKFEEEVYMDFVTAAEVRRSRSVSDFTHQLALKTIDDVKKSTPRKLWDDLRAERQRSYEQRSEKKTQERLRGAKTRSTAPTTAKKKAL